MLSHFIEQYDTKYIFKGVSWNKDDCHSEKKKKGFLISSYLLSVNSLNSCWENAITSHTDYQIRGTPSLLRIQVYFPSAACPAPSGQPCLSLGPAVTEWDLPLQGLGGGQPQVYIPFGWEHGFKK